ncbi:MAG: hypothetical protein ACC726_12465 [Chloroflexota bacterium]
MARLSGVIGATLLVLAVAAAGLYVLARLERVRALEGRRLLGAVLATGLLGLGALLSGGASLIGMTRLLPIPIVPSEGDMALAYSSAVLGATAVIAFAFLAFLWLIRPFAIDEAPHGTGVVSDEQIPS